MKAAIRARYGGPESLEIAEVEKPIPTEEEVLVKVKAVSLNIADWYSMGGKPHFARLPFEVFKPKNIRLGVDLAGVVEAVGANVTDFKPGDEVFGGRNGAFAEYVCARKAITHKPANVSFEEAAAVPVAALTALQAVRDKGGVQPGQKVLINGASGGVGTFTIQMAKAFGAEVTAVCSTRNLEQARALGADHVIDYTREDFTRGSQRYDLMINVSGGRPWRECQRVLTPEAKLVIVGAPRGGGLLGPLTYIARTQLATWRSKRSTFFIAQFNRPDMDTLAAYLAEGKIRPVVEKQYAFEDIASAFRYMGEGHVRGKLVIRIG